MDPILFEPYPSLAAAIITQLPGTTDGSHDHSHLLRVWNNAKAIQAREGGDLELLAAAVLLHDCVLIPKSSPRRSEASRHAAAEAARILESFHWPEPRIRMVADAIRTHSFSAGLSPTTVEGRVLQDADRLDAIGFIGIARCFYAAGRVGSQLYDPTDPAASARPLDDRSFALDHFQQKLLKLAATLTTETGRVIAESRAKTLETFYQGILAEIGG